MISCFSDAATYVSLCRPHRRFGNLARSRFSYAQCNNQETGRLQDPRDLREVARRVTGAHRPTAREAQGSRRQDMNGKKGWGSTVAGWVIERGEGAGGEGAARAEGARGAGK